MKLQVFSGGLATRKAPHLIKEHEAIEYLNINNETGNLEPVKGKTLASIAVNQYAKYFVAQAEWVSSATIRDYVEFQEKLYWADRSGQPQKYDGTNTYNLGITAPTAAASGVVQNGPNAITRIDLTATTGGNLPTSTLISYKIVNKDTVTGLESSVFLTTVTTSSIDNAVDISDIDTNFADEADIYRLFDGKYRLVTTFTSAASSFTDLVFDISANAELVENGNNISGSIQYGYTFYNSADGVESALSPISNTFEVSNGEITLSAIEVSLDPQVDQKKLYRLGGAITEFSLVATLANATTSYLDSLNDAEIDGSISPSSTYSPAPSGLKYLIEANESLFGVIDNEVRFSEIGLPDAWPITNSIKFPSPPTAIGDTANGILVCTLDRTYIITGTSPTTYAKYLLSGDQGCIAFESMLNYGTALLWASNDGICSSDGSGVTIITQEQLGHLALTPVAAALHNEVYYLSKSDGNIFTLDFRYGNIAKEFSLGVSSVIKANYTIYGWEAGQLYTLFTDATKESMTYLSPEFTEDEFSNLKTYNEIYVCFIGTVTIEVFIDGTSVITQNLDSAEGCVEVLKVPQNQRQGYKLQFKITGTGTVHEINTSPMGRQK